MTILTDPTERIRCELRCHHQEEHKLIELLLAKEVAVFDVWQCQRYGLQASQLSLIEQVRGFVRYSYASCELPYRKAIEIKQALHQTIPNGECTLLQLMPCDTEKSHS